MKLHAQLTQAHQNYTKQNPKSQARHQKAKAAMPGGNTRSVLYNNPFPLAVDRAKGSELWDLDGHHYFDFLGEYTAGLYGHSHPVIRQALDQALDKGISFGGANEAEAQFAKVVCERFPSIELVRFTNSGTEANLMAITAARAYTARPKILVFRGAYHGGVLYFSGGEQSPVNAPYDFVLAPYNNVPVTQKIIEANAPELAAVILEPMMGSGGCIEGSQPFLQMLRDETTRHGIVLIFDEVMTSRLAPGGLQEDIGILPDLTSLGKYIGGGMSFGAFGGRADLMAQFDPASENPLPHAGTFNNNVLTMNAGLTGLTEVYTPEAAATLNQRGDALRTRLNQICQRHETTMQFTGRGSMMNVHMTDQAILSPEDVASQNHDLRELFYFDMTEAGIWMAPRGMITVSLPMVDQSHGDIGAAAEERLVSGVQTFVEKRAAYL